MAFNHYKYLLSTKKKPYLEHLEGKATSQNGFVIGMKGAVELTIKLLLLLWIHSMVECPPITCPLARNFVKYGPNGEIVDCRPCRECAEGHGLSIQCGSQITNDSKIECVSCKLNKTYSDSHGIGSCRTCQYCGLRNVIRQCSRTQNRICGDKCPKGYFFDGNINDCLEVKSETSATAKSTESTPTVRQNPDHSTTTKRHLKTEAYEDTIAVSHHSVLIKPSGIQPRHSSLVVGITPTATPFGTTKAALLAENNDTASVLLTQKVQHGQKNRMLSIIIIVLVAVMVLLLVLLIIIVYRARQESPRTQPELRDSAEEIPLNSIIDEIEDSSNASISSFTTQEDLTDHASPDKAKELITPADFSADDIRTNEVSPNETVDKLNLALPAEINSDGKYPPTQGNELPEVRNDQGQDAVCIAENEIPEDVKLDVFPYYVKDFVLKLDVNSIVNKYWKHVADRFGFCQLDIKLLEQENLKPGGSATRSLIDNLCTKNVSLKKFVDVLREIERHDVADDILKWFTERNN